MITTSRRIAAVLGALPLAALVWTAQTAPAVARSASVCSDAVAQTKQHLAQVGAPTSHTGWQDVRDDAQRFIDEHNWNGGGVDALRRDVQKLNYYCAP